ncbi:MAG: glycosyltransferase family 4 protein [Phycisphaerales bacterium]|nr:glycosyltransferase family 4 protein [Phycisphaerales bacterium]
MKIAVVIERTETWRGGAETSTQELSQLLTQRGHEVHLITTTNSQSRPDIIMHTLPTSSVLRGRRSASFARKAAAFLKEHSFDIVHSISPLPCADVYQPRSGLLRETMARNVATRSTASRRLLKRAMLAMNVKQRALLDLERQVFRPEGPMIVAVSDYVARQCQRLYEAPESRIRVVFNGVNLQTLRPEEQRELRTTIREEHRLTDDTLLLLFMAHNFRLKGLHPLIEMASRLLVSGFARFHLLVVGRDNVVPFQKRVNALGLKEHVTFTGPTQRSTSFFAGADICVHPTYYDPCSRVVLEALSMGVPTVTTSFNGAAEVIRDGYEGFVIKTPDDVGLWARRIEDLASPELRRSMSENALKLRDRISMTRHVEELDKVFNEIADRKRCRAVKA